MSNPVQSTAHNSQQPSNVLNDVRRQSEAAVCEGVRQGALLSWAVLPMCHTYEEHQAGAYPDETIKVSRNWVSMQKCPHQHTLFVY